MPFWIALNLRWVIRCILRDAGQDLVHRKTETRAQQDSGVRFGQQVDKRNAQADKSDPILLSVSLPALRPGKYKVVWRVVSVDTHVTTGNFAFEVTR